MAEEIMPDLLSPIKDLGLVRLLLEDLHYDLLGKVARFRQLADLSGALGSGGTMLPGGETTYAAWSEARTSFIHVSVSCRPPTDLAPREGYFGQPAGSGLMSTIVWLVDIISFDRGT
nr:hypothetical protein [uncultured Rhodopila sp.]